MNFGTNKTPIEIIKEGGFGGTSFRDIYSSVNDKFYKNSLKEFKELESIDKKYYSSDYYDVSVNKYGVEDDQRQIQKWKGIVNRFKGILIKMIKNIGG